MFSHRTGWWCEGNIEIVLTHHDRTHKVQVSEVFVARREDDVPQMNNLIVLCVPKNVHLAVDALSIHLYPGKVKRIRHKNIITRKNQATRTRGWVWVEANEGDIVRCGRGRCLSVSN